MADRCTGSCCRRFRLPYSPGELARVAEAARAGADDFALDGDAGRAGVPLEVEEIAGMVELVDQESRPRSGQPDEQVYFYWCRNLLTSGDCGIYERRPQMCRNFPDRGICFFPECGWDAVRSVPPDAAIPPARLVWRARAARSAAAVLAASAACRADLELVSVSSAAGTWTLSAAGWLALGLFVPLVVLLLALAVRLAREVEDSN